MTRHWIASLAAAFAPKKRTGAILVSVEGWRVWSDGTRERIDYRVNQGKA